MNDPAKDGARVRGVIEVSPIHLGAGVVMMPTTGLLFCWPPRKCRTCGGMRAILRNKGGETLCLDCHGERGRDEAV